MIKIASQVSRKLIDILMNGIGKLDSYLLKAKIFVQHTVHKINYK